jgi:peptide/nickel transport system permease protein
MTAAILRRLVLAGLTVVLGGLVSATLVRYAPGFGTDERQLDARLSSDSLMAIENETAQQRRIVPYYFRFFRRALRGDLGVSRSLNRPVREVLGERVAVTARLLGRAMTVAWLTAVSLVFAAWLSHRRALNLIAGVAGGTLLCLPAGALALLSILLNAPPWLALALILFPETHRYLDHLVKATGRMQHVLAAKAKGIGEAQVLLRHVLPVIRREVLALAGVTVGLAISAAIPVEALCGVPGIGQLAWQSALARDLPVLINLSILIAAAVTLANSGADLLSGERRQPL